MPLNTKMPRSVKPRTFPVEIDASGVVVALGERNPKACLEKAAPARNADCLKKIRRFIVPAKLISSKRYNIAGTVAFRGDCQAAVGQVLCAGNTTDNPWQGLTIRADTVALYNATAPFYAISLLQEVTSRCPVDNR